MEKYEIGLEEGKGRGSRLVKRGGLGCVSKVVKSRESRRVDDKIGHVTYFD